MSDHYDFGIKYHPSIVIPILVAVAVLIFSITRYNKQAEANKQPQEQPTEAVNE